MIKLTPEKPPYYENVETTKIYIALLTQQGTNAPVVTELTNTIGTIIWTRDSQGIYKGTRTDFLKDTIPWAIIANNSGQEVTTFVIEKNGDNTIDVITKVSGAHQDGRLADTSIQIIIKK